jgi:hypothetical protein
MSRGSKSHNCDEFLAKILQFRSCEVVALQLIIILLKPYFVA